MDLEKLWKSRLQSLIGQIAPKETEYIEIRNTAKHIQTDYAGRFLIELIQNAEDQAQKAKLKNAKIIVIRDEGYVAVLNQGLPFDDKGLRSITSIGMSQKNPEETIGNKGIGFKAVYQITDSPEIYSAPNKGRSFFEYGSTPFRMQQNPLQDECFKDYSKILIEEILKKSSSYIEQMEENWDVKEDNAVDFIIQEMRQAAPFKFPILLDRAHLDQRIQTISLPARLFKDMSTLVFLPLKKDNDTQDIVDEALNEIVDSALPGSGLLFLNAITSLRIYNRYRNKSHIIRKKSIGQSTTLARGTQLSITKTQSANIKAGCIDKKYYNWILLKRRIGVDGTDQIHIENEIKALQDAAQKLDFDNWRDVKSASVSVAYPLASKKHLSGQPLGPNGLFCIGLPSKISTGSPVWLDGPFHGNIARTAINTESIAFNKLLFEEQQHLFWQGIDYLKQHNALAMRRLVPLLFEKREGGGPFSDALFADYQFSEKKIILGRDKHSFLKPSCMVIPQEEDSEFFCRFFFELTCVEDFGLRLPERELLLKAKDILKDISPQEQDDHAKYYLTRNANNLSLLELVVECYRTSGPNFWEKFFAWVLERFDVQALKDQKIIPVGESTKLIAPQDNPFFRPYIKKDDLDQNQADDDGEEDDIIDELDASLLQQLDFFDEKCFPSRRKDRPRDLTELASRLSPTIGEVLVRRPRKVELINELIIPFLNVHYQDHSLSNFEVFDLLKRIAFWIQDIAEAEQKRVQLELLKVPVAVNDSGRLTWNHANQVYYGEGWLDNHTSSLLQEAYGYREKSILIAWTTFKSLINAQEDEKKDWEKIFGVIGVESSPRIISKTMKKAALKSYGYANLSINEDAECPIAQAASFWKSYLDDIRFRNKKNKYQSGSYIVKPVTWIDGLEMEESRRAVFQLILYNAKKYECYLSAKIERIRSSDDSTCSSFWISVIKNSNWEIIRTNNHFLPPRDIWFIEQSDKRRLYISQEVINYIDDRYRNALDLLNSIGIYSIDFAPLSKTISSLQNVAQNLDFYRKDQEKGLKSFVRALFQNIVEHDFQSKYDPSDQQKELKPLLNAPIPLFRNEELVPADLSKIPIVYLDDEHERSKYIPHFSTSYSLPVRPTGRLSKFLELLKGLIGEEKVKKTSEEKIVTDFTVHNKSNKSIVSYLEGVLPEFSSTIAIDLAALLAFGRPHQPMNPKKEEFKRTWNLFQQTKVLSGSFPDGSMEQIVFDAHSSEGPVLQVPEGASPYKIIKSLWQLVGTTYRDLFLSYATELEHGNRKDFFNERQVTEIEIDEVASVVEYRNQNMENLKSFILGRWFSLNTENINKFYDEWQKYSKLTTTIAQWTQLEEKEIKKALNLSSYIDDSQYISDLLKIFKISSAEWQESNKMLGIGKKTFQSTVDFFAQIQDRLTSYFKVSATKQSFFNPNVLQEKIQTFEDLECPDNIKYSDINESTAIDAIQKYLTTNAIIDQFSLRQDEIITFLNLDHYVNTHEFSHIFPPTIPRREFNLYLNETISQREKKAIETFENALKVFIPLAKHYKENINKGELQANPKISVFMNGYWTNRFAILSAMRDAIFESAPQTARRIKEQRVLAQNQDLPWPELWEKFPELGAVTGEVEEILQKPVEESLLGLTQTKEAMDYDLAKGTSGALGKKLIEQLNKSLDLGKLATTSRTEITAPFHGKGKAETPRKYSKRQDQHQKDRIGLLGEAFVYESLRELLNDFDYSNWVSENREKYGFVAPETSGEGYDFHYVDSEGKLTGRADSPICLIEVKATSGPGYVPFPISYNEWEVARNCHNGIRKELYVIVRVSNALEAPQIDDVLVDPVDLYNKKFLELMRYDMLIYTKSRTK